MAILNIDTQDETIEVLAAASRFLAELAGEPVNTPAVADEPHFDLDGTESITENGDLGKSSENLQATSQAVQTVDQVSDASVETVMPEMDGTGRIWDERIDSSSKAKNANGTWKARRNVSAETKAAVLAELLGNVQAGAATAQPANTVASTQAQTPATVPPAAGAPSNTPDPDVIFGNQQAGEVVVLTWPEVLQRLTKAQNGGTLNQEDVKAFLAENSVANMPLMSNRADLFPAFVERLGI